MLHCLDESEHGFPSLADPGTVLHNSAKTIPDYTPKWCTKY